MAAAAAKPTGRQRLASLLIVIAVAAVVSVTLLMRPDQAEAIHGGSLSVTETAGQWTDHAGQPVDLATYPLIPGRQLRYAGTFAVDITGDLSVRVETAPVAFEGDPELIGAIETTLTAVGESGPVGLGGEVVTGPGRHLYDVEMTLELPTDAPGDIAGKAWQVVGGGLIATQAG